MNALEAKLASDNDDDQVNPWDRLLGQMLPRDDLLVELPQLNLQKDSSLVEAMRSSVPQLADVLFDPLKADFGAVSSLAAGGRNSPLGPLHLSDLIQLTRLNISSVATIQPTTSSSDRNF